MSLIDAFLQPETEPDFQHVPESDAECFARAVGEYLVLEVFRRQSGSFGFRYVAWVAWRDAGNEVRSHSWHAYEPPDSGVFDLQSAREAAERFAHSNGLVLQRWLPAV